MTDEPLPTLSDQIDAVTREIQLVRAPSTPEDQVLLQQDRLTAAVRSLEYLNANRDWIVAEAKARKERGE